MPTMLLTLLDGSTRKLEGNRFSYYVENVQYWFFVHDAVDGVGATVSHFRSGKKVTGIPHITLQAHLGDRKAAAKAALAQLIERVGEARVGSVLRAAEA